MEIDYELIGENIKIYRIRRKMKQAQLAELVGVTAQHISHIESAHTKLSLPLCVKIANALSVELNSILGFHTDAALAGAQGAENLALYQEILLLLKDASAPQKRQCVEICRAAIEYSAI